MKTRLIFIRTASLSRLRAIAKTGCDAPSSRRASSSMVTRMKTSGITPKASLPSPETPGINDIGNAMPAASNAKPR